MKKGSAWKEQALMYLFDFFIVGVLVAWVRLSVTWLGYFVAIFFAAAFFITRVAQQSIRSKFMRDVYVQPQTQS